MLYAVRFYNAFNVFQEYKNVMGIENSSAVRNVCFKIASSFFFETKLLKLFKFVGEVI